MGVSKAIVFEALATFKGLQDAANVSMFVAKEADKALISNADLLKLDGIAIGAQVNIIEAISVDGVAQTVNNKAVALDLSAYVKGTEVASAIRYKAKVNSYSDLSSGGQKIGDMYGIKTAGGVNADGIAIKAGDNVFWNGTGWDVLSGNVDFSNYVEKVDGKYLSTNDFTDELKEKLESLTLGETNIEVITAEDVQALFN